MMNDSESNGFLDSEGGNLEELPLIWDHSFFNEDKYTPKHKLLPTKKRVMVKRKENMKLQHSSLPSKVVKTEVCNSSSTFDLSNGFQELAQKYPMVSFRKIERKVQISPVNLDCRTRVESNPLTKAPPVTPTQPPKSFRERGSDSRSNCVMPKLESLAGYQDEANLEGQDVTRVSATQDSADFLAPPSPPAPCLSPQVSIQSLKSQENNSSVSVETSLDLRSYFNHSPKTITVETYYCGELEGKPFTSTDFPEHLQCVSCDITFESNVEVFAHMFNHGPSKLDSSSVWCPYCMKPVVMEELENHVQNFHHMIEGLCCRICERRYKDEYELVIHMWANHCRYDMPYTCGICDYRSSLKFQVIEHFSKFHHGSSRVLCPICLKVLASESKDDVTEIFAHTQLHQLTEGHRCGHCALVFAQGAELRAHFQEGSHTSKRRAKNSREVMPYQNIFGVNLSLMPTPPPQFCDDIPDHPDKSSPRSPKKRLRNGRRFARLVRFNRSKLKLNVTEESCLECGSELRTEGHFLGKSACNKCGYSSCCRTALRQHSRKHVCEPARIQSRLTTQPQEGEPQWLDVRYLCTCGFRSVIPDRIASHLARCCQTTAFPES